MLFDVDFDYGMISEKKNINILSEYFKMKLIKDPYRYAKFDFYNEDKSIMFELKSRRNNKNTFNTTFMPVRKINYIKEENIPSRRYFFVVKFLDALCYIEYNEELFKTFKITKEYIKHRNIYDNMYNIPIDKMKEIKIKMQLSSESEKEI